MSVLALGVTGSLALKSCHKLHMKLGLIGCGKMGSALLEGILKAKLVKPAQVFVCDAHAPSAACGAGRSMLG